MMSFGIGFGIGIFLGSLVYCLALRSLTRESFLGRSYCPRCKHILSAYDLLPVFSYLFLQGKCRFCKQQIPFEYLLVEVSVGLLTALLFYLYLPAGFLAGLSWQDLSLLVDLTFKTFIVAILVAILITDLKTGLIPDRITYPAIMIALAYRLGFLFAPGFSLQNTLNQPDFWAILSGLGIMLFFGILIFVTWGRGMGGGDLKIGGFIGLALGFPASILGLMLAFLTGSIVGILLLATKKKHFGQTIPFGPFLATGSLTALFWGKEIINWYLTLIH